MSNKACATIDLHALRHNLRQVVKLSRGRHILAMIKADIGDYALAEEDLTEAYNIACVNKFNDYVTEIEKKALDLAQNKLTPSKLVSRYSDDLPNNSTAE